MIKYLFATFKWIDFINDRIGRVISLALILVMLAIGTATISRYFLGKPLPLIWPCIKQVFAILILLGAPYAMLYDKHVRVEILYDFFPKWLQKLSRLVSLAFFMALTGAMTWQGIQMAKMSYMLKEVSQQSRHIPIYPLKIFVPIATFIFLLQGISYFLRKEGDSDDKDQSEKISGE